MIAINVGVKTARRAAMSSPPIVDVEHADADVECFRYHAVSVPHDVAVQRAEHCWPTAPDRVRDQRRH